MKTIFLTLLALALSVPAHAQWSLAETSVQAQYFLDFDDPYAASIWRAANSPWYMASDFPNYKEEELVLNFSQSTKKYYIKAGTFLHKDSSGQVLKRPLMVFLPGIFSNFLTPTSLMHGLFFYSKGYNVLLLSNPWSKKWIVELDLVPMGDLDFEIKTIKKMVEAFKNKFAGSTSSVSYFGYSYGAFMAAAVAGSSLDDFQNGVKGDAVVDTYLVGPPFDLFDSMVKLDNLADQTYSQIQSTKSLLWPALSYVNKNSQSEISDKELKKASAVAVYGGFVENFADSLRTYGYVHNIGFEPPSLAPADQRKWKRSLRFSYWIKNYLPGYDNLIAQNKVRLEFWLNKAALSSNRIRVLTSIDDFINNASNLNSFSNDNRFMILPNGGHVGYMNTNWYWDLLDQSFNPQVPRAAFPVIK